MENENKETLEIQLIPSYDNTAKKESLDPDNDDTDGDAILFQQGMDIDYIDIEKGEKFSISSDFEHGIIDNSEHKYKFIKFDYFNNKKEILEKEENIFLEPGDYIFNNDGTTIEQLK